MLNLFHQINVNAQAPNWAWAKACPTASTWGGESFCAATDNFGNVYFSGCFRWQIKLGSYTLNSILSGNNFYIAKYSSQGNCLWAKMTTESITNVYISDLCFGFALATDLSGNVYATGKYNQATGGNVIFGSTHLAPIGNDDIFIVKYDSLGNVIWAKNAGGTGNDQANGIAVDNSGNLYLTGVFTSSVLKFSRTDSLSNSAGAGIKQCFLAKYNANTGNVIWARGDYSGFRCESNSVAVDTAGDIYITGTYNAALGMYLPGDSIPGSTGSGYGMFLAKYNPSGNVLWDKRAFGTGNGVGNFVGTSNSGKIFVTGAITSPNFDFSNDTLYNTNSSAFIAQYDTLGNLDWVRGSAGDSATVGYGLASDTYGNVYISGYMKGPITFDSISLSPPINGTDPMYFIEFNSMGNSLQGNVFCSGGDDQNAVAADRLGNVYLTGDYESNPMIFGSDTMPSTGGINYGSPEYPFIAKLFSCSSTSVLNIISCGSYVLNNKSYFSSGTYTQHVLSVTGCDSTINLNLIINSKYSNNVSASICQGNTYTFPDGYTDTVATVHTSHLNSIHSCDSIVVTTLSVNPNYSQNISASICQGNTYTFPDGYTDTIATVHISHLSSIYSCDSIIVTNLTINNAFVTQSGNILSANTTTGSAYQWLDCMQGNAPIAGATSQTYTVTINGSYAVVVVQNGCTDTSTCYIVSTVNIADNNFNKSLSLYPNPATTTFTIESTNKIQSIKVFDILGEEILKQVQNDQRVSIDVSGIAKGIYFVQITDANKNVVNRKVVVQ